ncbi:hypothetical protein ACP4OV_009798 [Aristida adscensionis]
MASLLLPLPSSSTSHHPGTSRAPRRRGMHNATSPSNLLPPFSRAGRRRRRGGTSSTSTGPGGRASAVTPPSASSRRARCSAASTSRSSPAAAPPAARRPLLIEGDDLTLVCVFRGESRQTRIPRDMEEEILEVLGRFRGICEVEHIFREGNQVADMLCKEAYRCSRAWINSVVPFAVRGKVEDDRHGVVHERVKAI